MSLRVDAVPKGRTADILTGDNADRNFVLLCMRAFDLPNDPKYRVCKEGGTANPTTDIFRLTYSRYWEALRHGFALRRSARIFL